MMENKQKELKLYLDLNLAVMDYMFEKIPQTDEPTNFNAKEYFARIRGEAQKLYDSGDLTTLKKWFNDYISVAEERGELELKPYVTKKTGYKFV